MIFLLGMFCGGVVGLLVGIILTILLVRQRQVTALVAVSKAAATVLDGHHKILSAHGAELARLTTVLSQLSVLDVETSVTKH